MARIRTVKPEFWTSEQIMELSPMARLLFIGLWNFCDDKGVHPVAFKTLKAEVFPADDLLVSDVEKLVGELIAHGLLTEFSSEGRNWWFVTGWHHQVINRPSKSRYPEPPRSAPLPSAAGQADMNDADDATDDAHEKPPDDGKKARSDTTLTDDSLSTHGRKGREGRGREGKGLNPHTSNPARDPAEVFPMYVGWQPSTHWPELARQAGFAVDGGLPETGEFVAYWLGRPDEERTQHQWDHALLKSLKVDAMRATQTPPARAAPAKGGKFDPVAFVNQNRKPAHDDHDADHIDSTAERLA